MPSHRLRRQLPLWIALVLTATVVVTGWGAYYELHRAILASVGERLETAADEVGTLLHTSLARSRAEVVKLASAPELAAALADDNPRTAAAAQSVLAGARQANRAIGALVLWSADGKQIAFDGAPSLATATRPAKVALDDSGSVGKLVGIDSGFGYSVLAPVRIRGQAVGVLVRAQQSTTGGAGAALISRLVGKGSRILFGNADGDVWSDFTRTVLRRAAEPGRCA